MVQSVRAAPSLSLLVPAGCVVLRVDSTPFFWHLTTSLKTPLMDDGRLSAEVTHVQSSSNPSSEDPVSENRLSLHNVLVGYYFIFSGRAGNYRE